MSVCSQFSGLHVKPERPGRARSTEKRGLKNVFYLLLTVFTNTGVSTEIFTNAVVSTNFSSTGVSNKFSRMQAYL